MIIKISSRKIMQCFIFYALSLGSFDHSMNINRVVTFWNFMQFSTPNKISRNPIICQCLLIRFISHKLYFWILENVIRKAIKLKLCNLKQLFNLKPAKAIFLFVSSFIIKYWEHKNKSQSFLSNQKSPTKELSKAFLMLCSLWHLVGAPPIFIYVSYLSFQ